MPEDIVPPPDDERYRRGGTAAPETPEPEAQPYSDYTNPEWVQKAQDTAKTLGLGGVGLAYDAYKGLPKDVQEPVGKATFYGTTGGIGAVSDLGKTLGGKDSAANEEQTARLKAQMFDSLSDEGKRRYKEVEKTLSPDQQSKMLRDLSLMEKRDLMTPPDGSDPSAQPGPQPMAGGGGGGGAPRGPGMAVDDQGNLMPGLVRTQMSKTVQGQTPVPKEVPELIMDAAKHDVAGVAGRANAEAQAAQAQAEGAAGVKVLNEKMALSRQRAEQSRVNEISSYMDDLEKRLGALESNKIDPDYAGSLTGGQKFMMALGLFTGTLGAALSHSENVAMKLFQQQAADYINAQKANYQIQKDAFSAKKSLYGDLLETHKDERLAEKEMEAMAYKQMEAELKRRLAVAQDPAIRAQLEAGIAGIEKELAKSLFGLSQAMYGKTSISEGYSLPKPRGGGGAPKKPKDAHWLAEKTKDFSAADVAGEDLTREMRLYKEAGEPDWKLNPLARKLWEESPMAYTALMGKRAAEVQRASDVYVERNVRALSGAAVKDDEFARGQRELWGGGGIGGLQRGVHRSQGQRNAARNRFYAADPEQTGTLYEGHQAQGTDFSGPKRYVPTMPADE